MRYDSRFSGVLHVLLHMAETEGPVTSKIMAGLRDAGLVGSEKGRGGGWSIAGDPASITLRDVYNALGAPEVFALANRTKAPACPVEQSVNAALDDAFQRAEALLLSRFSAVTLAELGADFHARLTAGGKSVDLETIHAE